MSSKIITIISTLRPDAKVRDYKTNDQGIVEGLNTNDAPVKYLLNSVYSRKSDDKCTIISIVTKEAEPAYVVFKSMISDYCVTKGFCEPKTEKISFDNRQIGSVINDIVNIVEKSDSILVDTTGGFRDSAYILMTTVRMLEYSGVKLEKAVYSVLDKNNDNNNRIENITETYRIFDLISASDSFTSWGNSDKLVRFFSNSKNEHIRKLTDVMSRFSDDVAMCRTSKLNELVTELNTCLSQIQDIHTDAENEILFKSISGVIKEKFGIEYGHDIDILDVIVWCLNNKMIQQAVTFFTEKLPEGFCWQESCREPQKHP